MKTKTILCGAVLAAALIFKFWLVAGMEIEDAGDDPANYVQQILFNAGLCYGPGTGYAGKFFYHLGVPFRTGIETAWLAAIVLTVKALFEWPFKSVAALGLCLVMMFNPAPEELLSHLMSDQVWLVETLAGLSLLTLSARDGSKVRWLCVALAGSSLGLSTVTRSVLIPLLAAFVLWAAVCAVLIRLKGRGRGVDRRAAGGCAICLYAILLFYETTCFYNARVNGFHGISALDSTEYRNFYMCLQSVGAPTGVKYFPIDDARLKLIAQAGPKSQWFVEQLAKDSSFREEGRQFYGKYDLALTWFPWAVFETVDADGDNARMFALFRDVEREIAQAGREKRLEVRPILPLPDCRIALVLSALPDAAAHVAALTTHEPSRYAWDWGGEPKFDRPDFTRALHRRTVTPNPVRDKIGRALGAVYGELYAPLFWLLPVALGLFAVGLGRRWKSLGPFSAVFLTRQLFAVCFAVLFAWYVLFDASGLLAVSRYLIFHNVMLPPLLVYYARLGWRLLRGENSLEARSVFPEGQVQDFR